MIVGIIYGGGGGWDVIYEQALMHFFNTISMNLLPCVY